MDTLKLKYQAVPRVQFSRNTRDFIDIAKVAVAHPDSLSFFTISKTSKLIMEIRTEQFDVKSFRWLAFNF